MQGTCKGKDGVDGGGRYAEKITSEEGGEEEGGGGGGRRVM